MRIAVSRGLAGGREGRKTMAWAAVLLFALSGAVQGETRAPTSARIVSEGLLSEPTTWAGDVIVRRSVVVTKTASLTLQPGTRVFFDLPEPPASGDYQPWLLVLGSIEALGTAEAPIVFTALGSRQNQEENMIDVQEARAANFLHCSFVKGPWGLHLHHTKASVESCLFRDNYGGLRFKGGPVVVRGSRFQGNRIGVRCLEASPVIEANAFSGNLTGIFFRQEVLGAVIRRNDFDNTEYDVKLGEFQEADLDASGNWWKAAKAGTLPERIFDGADSEGVGRVHTEPLLPAPQAAQAPQ